MFQGLQQINVFGQQQYEGSTAPASPGDWSVASDSWSKVSTPKSTSHSAGGSQSYLHSHREVQEVCVYHYLKSVGPVKNWFFQVPFSCKYEYNSVDR